MVFSLASDNARDVFWDAYIVVSILVKILTFC